MQGTQAHCDSFKSLFNMDTILKQKITDKLRAYLKREPSDAEVINGQTDANLMHWIAQDDVLIQQQQIDALGVAAHIDLTEAIKPARIV